MNNIQPLKGFRDFLPKEAKKRLWLKSQIEAEFKLWGFEPMETPTLEPLELFVGQIGEDEQLFFRFKDNADRDVALRYDQTVPTCRVVGTYSQSLPMPFRRYQIQPAFRAEKPQRGRYREFVQCDADIFGEDSYIADAEVIALSLSIYKRLGFKNVCVLVNDRELLSGVPYEAIVAIDKLEKTGQVGVIRDMIDKGIKREIAIEFFKKVKGLQPNEKIINIFKYLKDMGFEEDWYRFEPTLSRSFSYSTGPIWEVKINGSSGGSVLGGERYDALVEKISGQKIPGTGFGLGFDRTLEACEEFGLIPDLEREGVMVITMDGVDAEEGMKIVRKLREVGMAVEMYPSLSAKFDKKLRYANKKGIAYVAILGETEIKQGKVSLKDMKTGEQEILSVEGMVKKLI